jgi:hypothetical protein
LLFQVEEGDGHCFVLRRVYGCIWERSGQTSFPSGDNVEYSS